MPPTADVASSDARVESSERIAIADLVTLAKPRITLMCVITTMGGIWLAERVPSLHATPVIDPLAVPRPIASSLTVAFALLGTALIVAGANALNMYIERDIDRHMARTKARPLPSRRLSPKVALWFGVTLSVIAVPILALGVNPLTALLAVLANVSYVLAYTPMKQRSHHSLLVGAVPGAIPPLLGWTAVTGRIDAGGAVLFAILFLWQIPHFLAITLFRRDEYARAGLQVMPNVTGDEAVRHSIVRWTVALVASTVLLVPLGIAHRGYFAISVVLGAVFFAIGCAGLFTMTPLKLRKWSRSLFAYSIVYLVILFAAIAIDPFA